MQLSRGHRDAALLGLASGMRAFISPTMLAWRGRLVGPRGRAALTALAAGEIAADKHPAAPSRTEVGGLIGRVGASAVSGQVVAGRSGAVVGLTAGVAGTYGCHAVRGRIARAGFPDPVIAVVEDALAVSLAIAATRSIVPRSRWSLRR